MSFETNGLGIVRHIALFDKSFMKNRPVIPIETRSDDPAAEKELGDAKAILPVLRDFRDAHPTLRYAPFRATPLLIPMNCMVCCWGNTASNGP